MSDFQKKAVMTLDGNIEPLLEALGQAQKKINEFEKKASKSGSIMGGGRGNTVGGVLSGSGGGGAAGTARAFFGGWMAAEATEAAMNSLTVGIRKYQYTQAKATGDLDKMAQAAIRVNTAQEQLASSFPVLGGTIARLMRVMGSSERLQEIIQIRAGMRSDLGTSKTNIDSLRDSIEILTASLSDNTKSQIDSIKINQDMAAAREKWDAESRTARGEVVGAQVRVDKLREKEKELITVIENRDTSRRAMEKAMYATANLEKMQDKLRQEESVLALAKKKQEKLLEERTKKETEVSLRLKSIEHEDAKRIADFVRDKEYEILQVKLNNEIADQEDAWMIWHRKSALLDIEENYLADKMKREKASAEEQDAVFRLFRQKEEALYGERQRAIAKEQEEKDKKERERLGRFNEAAAKGSTAAYISMSGAIGGTNHEQQTAQNTKDLVKESRNTNRVLHKLVSIQQNSTEWTRTKEFRRERLN